MVATITIDGAVAQITGDYPIGIVREVTSYYKQGYQFTPRYRSGHWDGKVHLLSRLRKTFPAGLVEDVRSALIENGTKVMVDDHRSCPPIPPIDKFINLQGVSFDYPYDYQPDCMEQMILKKRGVIAVATNGGKSEIACLVIACLRLPTLFLVPGKDLLYQTRKRFAERLDMHEIDIGIIGDGHWNPKQWITVATIDTLSNRLKKDYCREFLQSVDIMFADECHHVGSDSAYKVLSNCSAYFRYGMSGTPLKRSDGADLRLIAATGPVIYEIRNKELIERGVSSEVEIHFHKIKKPTLDKKMPYQDVREEGIVENLARNRKICSVASDFASQDKRVLILVRELAHGHELDKRLWTNKQIDFTPHQFINGKEEMEVRLSALRDFERGDLKILIATSILDEGVDIPNIDVLIFAGGGKSSIKTMQRVGRGIRRGDGNKRLIVVDFADFQHRYLLDHSFQRFNDYKAEDCFDILEVA